MITKLTILVMLGFTTVAAPQKHETRAVARTSPSASLAIPQFEKGVVEGRTYKNISVGLEIMPPPNFEFGTPELRGTPGTVPLLVTVGARGIEPGSPVWNGVTFYADALAYYPAEQRSTPAYLRKVIRTNRQIGFERVSEPCNTNWDGVSFSRVDFWRWPAYEAVLVKACNIQALVFIFSSSDATHANKVMAATQLRLNVVRSHCGPH